MNISNEYYKGLYNHYLDFEKSLYDLKPNSSKNKIEDNENEYTRLMTLVQESKSELDALNISYANVIEWKINYRAKRWGICKKKLVTDSESNRNNYKYTIEISSKLLQNGISDKIAKDTIIHELLHTVKGTKGHTGLWKTLAEKVNRTYGYNIKRVSSYEEKGVAPPQDTRTPKHKFVCTGCGEEVLRYKESKFTQQYQNYRCGKCYSPFKKVY